MSPEYQSFNSRTQAWVKYHFTNKGVEFTDVKQKNPLTPFKNIKIRGNKR